MIRILGVVIIFIGGWLVYTGHRRAESLAGKTQTGLVQLKNEIDGKTRVADHYWYYAGGAILILGGGWLVVRKD